MVHRYSRRLRRILEPYEFEQNCHQNLPDNQLELLKTFNHELKLSDELAESTRCDYLEKVSLLLRRTDKEVEEIEKKDIPEFLSNRNSSGSRRTYKTTLRQFFRWYYLDHKLVSEEEVPRFVDNQLRVTGQTGKDKVDKDEIPTKEEVQELLDTSWEARDRALIALLADKGMRIREALKIDLKRIHRDRAGIYIQVPEAKKDYESYRKNRLTWSRPILDEWLEHHPRKDEEDAPLFVKLQNRQDEPDYMRLKYGAARQMLDKLKGKADVNPDITLHKFRHYSTTKDRQKKHIDDRDVVKEKGWDDASMLEKYDHIVDDDTDKAQIRQMVEEGQLPPEILEQLDQDFGDIDLKITPCPNCGYTDNSPDRDYCKQCYQPFTDEGAAQQEKIQRVIKEVAEKKGMKDLFDDTGDIES